MKSATTALINLLKTNEFIMADLYTFTFNNGNLYYFTNADTDITYNSITYKRNGVFINRDSIKTSLGLDVSTLKITVMPQQGDSIESIGVLKLISTGGFDGARFTLSRLFLSDPLTPVGTINIFSGRVSDIQANRYQASITIKSDLELLNMKMPRNIYQPSCLNTLFDNQCGVAKTGYNCTVTAIDSTLTTITLSGMPTVATDYFAQGYVQFTSGNDTGQIRTIKNSSSGQIVIMIKNTRPLSIGDTCTIYAGCDRTQSTCSSKFSNLANFRGFPYIPTIESIL